MRLTLTFSERHVTMSHYNDKRSRDRLSLQWHTHDRPRRVDHSIMINVTWRHFNQSAKQLIVCTSWKVVRGLSMLKIFFNEMVTFKPEIHWIRLSFMTFHSSKIWKYSHCIDCYVHNLAEYSGVNASSRLGGTNHRMGWGVGRGTPLPTPHPLRWFGGNGLGN